ncbi:hypothetical protein OG562_08505 [Streptomyces sp. NBC_01275]|uniref:hypothetical protein n=1 Tax=Streptomyces sp. NBC_01275 TaxID=2903807 RepID=UPI002259428E|nr:hypothetical protein [Streptomyces sp. NBC_01275]MCX4761007.1 hypothetical protein [Streptomyces sp. NBC_01275]
MPEHRQTAFHEHETEVRPEEPFAVVRSDDGRWYTVTGPCPTCGARTVFRVAYGVLGASKGRRSPEPLTGAVPVYCQCGYPHPERPPESPDTGCGAFWDVPVPTAGQGGAP